MPTAQQQKKIVVQKWSKTPTRLPEEAFFK
jgi:hypothetical protein